MAWIGWGESVCGNRALPGSRHFNAISILAMTFELAQRGDHLAVSDPCGPADQALLKQFADAVRRGPIQPLSDQFTQGVGDGFGPCVFDFIGARWR